MNSFLIRLIVLITSLSIMACGFQLRGSIETNFDSIFISGGSEKFSKVLKKRFKQSGVRIKNSEEAEKIVEIIESKYAKKILSLSGGGKVREYQLEYIVTYRSKSIGSDWSEEIRLESTRDFAYDDDDLLAKNEEEKRLIMGMQDQIISSMVSQISIQK